MSDLSEAAEGAIALVIGGLVLLSVAGSIESVGFLDFTLWGVIYLVIGVLLLVTITAAAIGEVIGRLA